MWPTRAEFALRDLAIENGCHPKWRDGIFGWAFHCNCSDGLHNCDSQCSMIDSKSALKKRS